MYFWIIMNKRNKILTWIWIVLLVLILMVFAINIYVLSFSREDYYTDISFLEPKLVWLVFWAAVYKNSVPSAILKDRLLVAYEAYEAWKIKKILVSGDNSKTFYNEPEVMKKFLIDLWVKKDDIFLDYAWFDTYDSIYRAKEIFLAQELVLFTQDFHLKRAMYISKRLWIDTYWVETNLQAYLRANYYEFREILARLKAFLETDILHSKPKYLWETIEIISDERIEETKRTLFEEFY